MQCKLYYTRIINSERLIMVLQPTNQTTTTKYEKDVLILLVVTPVTRKKKPSSPNMSRTYDLLVTSPDALPPSYRRLVGAKAIKLVNYVKKKYVKGNVRG